MELTSGIFLALLVLLTVGAAAATVAFWTRLAPNRPTAIAGRVGALLGVNLLVLLTAGVVLNDTFGFFADWTDLTGSFQPAPKYSATVKGASAAAAAGAQVRGGDKLSAPAREPTGVPQMQRGQRQYSFDVSGPVSGVMGRVVVYLPEGYTDPAQAHRRYPVIETFHGYPGTPEQWLDSMNLGQVLDAQAAGGQMSPVLVVSPQLEIPKGRDTECVDGGRGQPAVETWLTTDVPNWVARTFRVSTERSSWAAAGLSAGGWCAAMAALLHPAKYGAAIVFGGYFKPDFGTNYRPFGAKLPPRYDLVALARSNPPPLAMWVETSHSDKLSYSSTAAFLKAVRAPLSVRVVEFAHAGHSIPLWASLVPDAVQWLATQVPGFRGAVA
jgi:enterochelin esterase-like enzyme